ncbi:MAG TPA: hypothetical protein VGW34_14380 [Allosphingosinicella sp.]|nr:hypothetical protein [Allosphingosinicella sp.]
MAVALLLVIAAPARALCIYEGVDHARTTIEQEFADSRWVVRARVVSRIDHRRENDEPWTLYRLQIVQAFKGSPPPRITYFTLRNSGGFYLDRPWFGRDSRSDVGTEWLLFLNPYTLNYPAAEGATEVNYNCGQSKRWEEATLLERQRLQQLAARRRQKGTVYIFGPSPHSCLAKCILSPISPDFDSPACWGGGPRDARWSGRARGSSEEDQRRR